MIVPIFMPDKTERRKCFILSFLSEKTVPHILRETADVVILSQKTGQNKLLRHICQPLCAEKGTNKCVIRSVYLLMMAGVRLLETESEDALSGQI